MQTTLIVTTPNRHREHETFQSQSSHHALPSKVFLSFSSLLQFLPFLFLSIHSFPVKVSGQPVLATGFKGIYSNFEHPQDMIPSLFIADTPKILRSHLVWLIDCYRTEQIKLNICQSLPAQKHTDALTIRGYVGRPAVSGTGT